ncbi:MAG: hypothetical protein RMY28_009705 [Nostoc sp. ChiSLP01]|nr:hypothetical protein [Nostoc sp. CmiSLP01]MDZ8285171.1 hypothetical protein [Nostoc sp. ChiSLP01]
MGNYVAIAALALTVWQVQDTRESKIEGAIASVGKDLEEAIAKVEADSDRRDSLHDQQLSQIQQQLSSMQREVEFHRVDIGRLQDHIFENKDKLAEHGATLAVLSKQGEIILAVDNMRSEFKKLEEQIKQLTLE